MKFGCFKISIAAIVALTTSQFSLAQGVEEITVTAQRKEQSLQDVSLSVAAFTDEQVKDLRIESVEDVTKLVSNLEIRTTLSGLNPAITIRGVGLNDFNSNNTSSVGVYIDEVFVSSVGMLGFANFDMERIEVLKGPQGTLYGRNSNGGAINFITKKPSHDESDGYVSLTAGNYETIAGEAVIGGPLTDQIAGRISIKHSHQGETYGDNQVGSDFGSSDSTTVRAQINAMTPSENFEVNMAVTYFDADLAFNAVQANGTSDVNFTGANLPPTGIPPLCPSLLATNQPALDGSCSTAGGEILLNTDEFDGFYADGHFGNTDIDGVSLNLTARASLTDTLTLTTVTGYTDMDRQWYDNITASSRGDFMFEGQHDEEFRSFNQEIRVAGEQDSFNWIGGLFFARDDIDSLTPFQAQDLPVLPGAFDVGFEQEKQAFAAFGHAEWDLNEQFRLIAGVRYNDSSVEFIGGTTFIDNFDIFGAGVDAPIPFTAGTSHDLDDESYTGRVALEFRPNDEWMVYGSYARGFKEQAIFADITFDPSEIAPVDPEEIDAFEIGFKSTLLDGTLQANAAAFFYDYADIQTLAPAPLGFRFVNAGETDVYGAELDLAWAPTDAFTLRAGLGWLDTEVKDDKQLGALNGNELPNAPEIQFNLLGNYDISLDNGSVISLQADYKFTDSYWQTVLNTPYADRHPKVDLLGARATLKPENGKWEVSIWGENLADEKYPQFQQVVDTLGVRGRIFAAPLTVGATLRYNFF